MVPSPSRGKIIIINGPSSAGKTTLALAVQDLIGDPFVRFSFDLFMESRVLPLNGIREGNLSWPAMRPAVFKGLHHCVAALAGAGNNVLFDHIIEKESWLRELVRLLASDDVFFVGLHCSLEELERREQQRGDRQPGDARRDLQFVHNFGPYDLELDAERPADENAQHLIAAWYHRRSPSAFTEMTRLFAGDLDERP